MRNKIELIAQYFELNELFFSIEEFTDYFDIVVQSIDEETLQFLANIAKTHGVKMKIWAKKIQGEIGVEKVKIETMALVIEIKK